MSKKASPVNSAPETPGRATAPAPRGADGRLLAADGLAAGPHARARQLAAMGRAEDPLGLCPKSLIAHYAADMKEI